MLTPLETLQEAGFAHAAGQGGGAATSWSPELILRLDWTRLSELARALAAEAGCELAGTRTMPDGSVLFGMIEQPRSAQPRRALVKLAPWNEWGAGPGTVERFAKETATARDTRGILIAPAGFSTAALHAAQQHRIESVDAQALHAALEALPAERSDFLLVTITSGDATTPSCPLCQQKLRREEQQPMPLPSRVIAESCLVADAVVCDRLEVAPGCEVTFLQEARSHEIVIAGEVKGDFVCHGRVILEPGATLTGTVAARALDVREGAELVGQFRILEGSLEPLVRVQRRWHWRCAGELGRAACGGVAFEPHDEA